jgi:hypothetical protein
MKTAWLAIGKRAHQVVIVGETHLAHGKIAVKVRARKRSIYVHSERLLMQRPLSARRKLQRERAEKVLSVLSDDWILIHDLASKLNSGSCGVWQTCASLARDGKLTMEYVEGLWKWRVKK